MKMVKRMAGRISVFPGREPHGQVQIGLGWHGRTVNGMPALSQNIASEVELDEAVDALRGDLDQAQKEARRLIRASKKRQRTLFPS
jgi:hypothetical protein